MTTLVFFLEEPSAQAMLESFLPRLLPGGYEYRFIVFEGKSDLDKRLIKRLTAWQGEDCRFIILRDQDSADCKLIKSELKEKCFLGRHPEAMIRIACRELESWYLGDLKSVEEGMGIPGIARHQRSAKYRNPDGLANAAEELRKVTNYRYQKVSGSRAIGKHLSMDRNKSHSFGVFVQGLLKLCGKE